MPVPRWPPIPSASPAWGPWGRCIRWRRSGPIEIRFYNLSSVASFAIPIGFYVDRLSAIMMTLITGVSVIIYNYSVGYMYQDRHARRYLAMICLTDFVLICMVSSSNLMMLFLFWQVLSYLLYVLAHNHAHAGTLAGAFKTFTLLRDRRHGVSRRDCPRLSTLRHARVPGALCAGRRDPDRPVAVAWDGDQRSHGRHVAFLCRRDGEVGTVSDPSLAAGITLRSDAGPCVAARGDHQCRRVLDQPLGAAVRPQLDDPARRLRGRHADGDPGRQHDAGAERHQEDPGVFHDRPDGLHDHGMRPRRLLARPCSI